MLASARCLHFFNVEVVFAGFTTKFSSPQGDNVTGHSEVCLGRRIMSEKATANKLYDADAPFLVESYQHGTGSFPTQESLPSYSYSNDPHMPGQLRSWDDAARASPIPIRSPDSGPHGHVYANVDTDNPYLGVGGAPSVTPAPLNATITGYATGLGWELSKLCAIAYAIPPFSSVLLLLYETQNVRSLSSVDVSGSCPFPCVSSRLWRCYRRCWRLDFKLCVWAALACLAADTFITICIMVLRVRLHFLFSLTITATWLTTLRRC